LLLCSDGLSGEIEEDRIWEILATRADPSKAAVALVEAVLEGPARDNVTAVVLDVGFTGADPTDEIRRTGTGLGTSESAEITADVDADAEARDVSWAPPVPHDRHPMTTSRTPLPPDGAAWGAPDPSSTESNPQ
jgi:protein phosphatase